MKLASFIILTLIPVALMEKAAEEKSEDSDRIKRSGFSLLGGAIQNLQKSAFGASASLSQGSAGGVAHLSSSSSSSGHSSHGYDTGSYGGHDDFDHHHDNHDSKGFDGWSLKKSILNTLLQAVKAIAGGVTTLKGQLIKGSGYVVEQKGKLIQSGGEQVSNAGKSIIHNAHLVKPDSSHGHASLGHSLGSSFGGLTKTISSLSAGSSGSLSSVSGASSSSSSSSSSHGHDSSYPSHGAEYAAVDGHGIEYTNSFDNYDTKPIVHESYGPPKTTISHFEQPHSIYGTPEYNDDTYKFAETQVTDVQTDVLSEILKNIPHKPMKTVTSGGHSFNQIPIPSDAPMPPPPPFKPLKNFPVYSPQTSSFENSDIYLPDYSGTSLDIKSINTNPKAYDAYHTMTMKLSKPQAVVSTSLPGPISLNLLADKDFEIQKSIQYEIQS
ncbi:hypothetical protein PVAND_004134 [Polypedilum vanderplanki]|uniref:Uncharacterized protein n=1 Tax=Polypedilum vanderplanki TaxID=319348 RepID=A0A9J6BY60_POLVA|nr:hypothetical protein PVAND_004134 [Polypedilum vanderplanki]